MIKTHKELAIHIAGKKILHLNSFGKDSVICLDWLCNYATCHVVSVNFQFMAPHPDDERYLDYLKKKYPQVEFLRVPNVFEITKILLGVYQLPTETYQHWNNFEFDTLDPHEMVEALRLENGCDYVCKGQSRYESFTRANFFHKKGIAVGNDVYPIGFMSKKQVFDLISATGVKLHPQYKMNSSTLDKPTYYKMRSAFIANPEYKKQMYKVFPLLELDEYRYEKLLK